MGRSGVRSVATVRGLCLGLLAICVFAGFAPAENAQARDTGAAAYHEKLLAVYDLVSQAPLVYSDDEVDKFGATALNMSGDQRLYALWRVLYIYKNDQNQAKLEYWHNRITLQALKDSDSDLDLLARFMLQAYQNETGNFTVLTAREWTAYLSTPDPALRNIVMLERQRLFQFQGQWAEAIDLGDNLVDRLQSEGSQAAGLLNVAQQALSYDMIQVGDYNAYADHMLAVAQLSRNNAFFLQKMDILYDLAYFAARDGDIAPAVRLQKLYGGYVRKYDIADLKPWASELCATVEDRDENYASVIDCLKDSAIARGGAIATAHDGFRLRLLTKAYAEVHDADHARLYLGRLQAVPNAVFHHDPLFDQYIDALLKDGQGLHAEAFRQLDDWATATTRNAEERRVDSVHGMYLALRTELDRKSAESALLAKQVQLRQLMFGAAALIALLLAVICAGIVLWVLRMRKMQGRLALAREHAEIANAAKTRFLAVMSHELRTPLNGVLGMAQALKTGDLSDAQQEQVDVLVDSGKTLMVLLNDVLDMSRIEAGKIDLAPTPASMRDMIARVINTYSSLIQGRPIALRSEFSEGAGQMMNFDVLRVYQCLSNLVSNALKFTEKGSVRLVVSAEPIIPDGGFLVRVEVRDTGIGMNRTTVDRLFEAYSQADASTARKYGGTGLGLSISRRLAELMGGGVSVTSEEGTGSCFIMTFKAGEVEAVETPAETCEPAPVPAPRPQIEDRAGDAEMTPGRRILLVDDHPVNRKVARLFLEPFGFVISEAVDGQAALDADMSRFDLVLMDLNMPKMGGLEATRLFRAAEATGRHVPIVALTADAMPDQVAACHAAGMDAHISKPILMDKLIETVNAMLERYGHGAEAAKSAVQ